LKHSLHTASADAPGLHISFREVPSNLAPLAALATEVSA
jgi:hypothetical protein